MKKHLYKFLSALFVVGILTTSASAAGAACTTATKASPASFDCTALLGQLVSLQTGGSCQIQLPDGMDQQVKALTTSTDVQNCEALLAFLKDCAARSNTETNCQTPGSGNTGAEPPEVTPPVTEPPLVTPPTTEPPVTEEPPVVTPPVTEPPVIETPPVTEAPSGISAYEMEVINLVNKIRAENGLGTLKASARLSEIARAKSQDMRTNGYFAHQSPTYGSPFDMLRQFGVSYRTAGENIAYGYATPAVVVEGWMNSQGHRENILKSTYTEIGVGYVESGHYWTQLFTG